MNWLFVEVKRSKVKVIARPHRHMSSPGGVFSPVSGMRGCISMKLITIVECKLSFYIILSYYDTIIITRSMWHICHFQGHGYKGQGHSETTGQISTPGSIFLPISGLRGCISMKLIKITHYQVQMTQRTFSRSWVQRSRSQTAFPKTHFFGGGIPRSMVRLGRTSSFLRFAQLICFHFKTAKEIALKSSFELSVNYTPKIWTSVPKFWEAGVTNVKCKPPHFFCR